MTAVTELHYLPCIAYFSLVLDFDELLLEKHEHYVKQSFRNRTYINTEHGKAPLIIPLTGKSNRASAGELRIDYSQKWVNNHWRTITSAYGKSPFFEYYCSDLDKILHSRCELLYDLNLQLLTMCLKWLRCPVQLKETLSYEKMYANEIKDLRNRLDAKNEETIRSNYTAISYQQVFGNSFVENLSIIDLIFCLGPEAGSIIKSSRKRE